ncbi:MAG: glucose-1-phosphate cytidylyltransferase [Acidobacteriota bacterium]
MKVVILCGGRGTRLGQESTLRPKPMAEIGGRPILWHIMKYFAAAGHDQFVLCLGHLGEIIKEYFLHYEARQNDVTLQLGSDQPLIYHTRHQEQNWRISLVNTGRDANTGARTRRIRPFVQDDEIFLLTYGDGVSDVDLEALLAFHRSHGKIATVTAVHPAARFGELQIKDGQVHLFSEKPQTSAGLINGGFFVLDRRIFDYLPDDPDCALEREPMARLAEDGQLMAFEHHGFWQCMDTVRELNLLRTLWDSNRAPWRRW